MNRLLKSFGAVTAPAAVLAGALSTAQAADAPFAGEPRPPATFTQAVACINGTPVHNRIDDVFQQMLIDYNDNRDYMTLPQSSIRLTPADYTNRLLVLKGDCLDAQPNYPIPPVGQDYLYHGDDKEFCGYDFARVPTTGIRQNGTPERLRFTYNNQNYDITYDTRAEIGGYWITVDDQGRQRNDGHLNIIPATRQGANVYIYNNRNEPILLHSTFAAMLGSAVGTIDHPFLLVDAEDCNGGAAIIGTPDPVTPPGNDGYGVETFCRDEQNRLIACDDTPRDPDAPPLPDPEMPVGDGRGDERADAGQHINTWAPAPVFA